MSEQIKLEVITPERRVFSEMVDEVSVPALGGELGILPGHTPLISQLGTGILAYSAGAVTRRLHVSGGFVEVNTGRVSVLADLAEEAEEIDADQARREMEQTEKQLGDFTGSEDEFKETVSRLERAGARLQLIAENNASANR
ncbi:MAG: F0F1 ATP synthase subunit epsilon [Pyrinomonadaceae bacterium]